MGAINNIESMLEALYSHNRHLNKTSYKVAPREITFIFSLPASSFCLSPKYSGVRRYVHHIYVFLSGHFVIMFVCDRDDVHGWADNAVMTKFCPCFDLFYFILFCLISFPDCKLFFTWWDKQVFLLIYIFLFDWLIGFILNVHSFWLGPWKGSIITQIMAHI